MSFPRKLSRRVILLLTCIDLSIRPPDPMTSFLDTRSVCWPHFSPTSLCTLTVITTRSSLQLISRSVSLRASSGPVSAHLISLVLSSAERPLWPLAAAGFNSSSPHCCTMRSLLESSWMKFGPAGRDALDWQPGPSALPSTDRQLAVSSHALIHTVAPRRFMFRLSLEYK